MIQNAIDEFDGDRRSRVLRCEHQLQALLLGHLLRVDSLRHLVTTWDDHRDLATSLGLPPLARSTLADATRTRPHEIFRAVTAQVIQAAMASGRGVPRRLKRASYCLDSTCMDLCASLYRWARFSSERSAIKLHTLMLTNTQIPELTVITMGKTGDMKAAEMMPIPPGSIISMDRAYCGYQFFADLHDQGSTFVTRAKSRMRYEVLYRWRIPPGARGVLCDQQIRILGEAAKVYGDRPLRRISYRDPETGQRLVFLTNSLQLGPATIAALYKDRWRVELFFKWIKQNLRVTTYWGRSQNAVLIQIWIALLTYAIVSWINLTLRRTWSRLRTLRFIQTHLLLHITPAFWICDA
jgi:hypothetical protein